MNKNLSRQYSNYKKVCKNSESFMEALNNVKLVTDDNINDINIIINELKECSNERKEFSFKYDINPDTRRIHRGYALVIDQCIDQINLLILRYNGTLNRYLKILEVYPYEEIDDITLQPLIYLRAYLTEMSYRNYTDNFINNIYNIVERYPEIDNSDIMQKVKDTREYMKGITKVDETNINEILNIVDYLYNLFDNPRLNPKQNKEVSYNYYIARLFLDQYRIDNNIHNPNHEWVKY